MRKWLAGKLFDWATSLDWDTTAERAMFVASIEIGFREAMAGARKRRRRKSVTDTPDTTAPKPKRGRPFGSKNKPKVAAEAPKKRGRPFGSKNKPNAEA